MIRFVDLTDFYWVLTRAEDKEMRGTDPACVKPVCAFLRHDRPTSSWQTTSGSTSATAPTMCWTGCQHGFSGRCTGLVPEGFWKS